MRAAEHGRSGKPQAGRYLADSVLVQEWGSKHGSQVFVGGMVTVVGGVCYAFAQRGDGARVKPTAGRPNIDEGQDQHAAKKEVDVV